MSGPETQPPPHAAGVPRVEDLREAEIFADLQGPQLQWLLKRGSCRDLGTGDSLWTRGQPADAMFVVLRGKVELFFDVMGQSLHATSDRW
ncbi:MAG: hypothetical protein MI919_05370, partial [Holophagales bacterium]|nr:hypothetical protein [Holophagales bacterium]